MSTDSNKEYSVNWKNHMSHVRKAFDNLLSTNELTDVTLFCEGKKIGAHKMLLSACSTYFRDTFKEVPCQHPVIVLYGVEHSVLSDILQFIYKGEVSVDTSKLDSFLKTAQLLQISGLTDDPADKIVVENDQNTEVTNSDQGMVEELIIQATSTNEDAPKRGTKRLKPKEVEAPREKIQRPYSDTLFVSDVKCEPTELVHFEDPLEDPLLQSDPANDTKEFVSTGTQGEEEFKIEMESDDDSDVDCPPPEGHSLDLLPAKSKDRYEFVYNQFMNWRQEKGIKSYSENVCLAYFGELSTKSLPSTLWTTYSMLKSTLAIHQNVDIARYIKLRAFLKRKSDGYKPRKAKTLTSEEINRFLQEAPDDKYLLQKVVLIIGISGACRKHELVQLKIDDIQDLGAAARIQIPGTETKRQRSFTIIGEFYKCYKKYAILRPPGTNERRFFLNYQHKKCTKQPVGKNKLANTPRQIASYLGLPEVELYTGHCYRRCDITTLKRHGGWSSTSVAVGQESVQKKIKIDGRIVKSVEEAASTSSSVEIVEHY